MAIATVDLLDYQETSLQDENQFLLWHGGRGSGKSHTLVMDLYNCCCWFPMGKFALVCNDHVQLRDSTHETLVQYLNKIGCPYHYAKVEKVLRLPNGSAIHELTFEKDKTSLKGAEWDGVFIDEGDGKNTTEEKFDYLIDSCRGKIGDRRIRVACNPVPPAHFLARRFFVDRRAKHVGFMVSTYMNEANLPEDYIPNLEAKYVVGSDEWKRWMMGELISMQGAVYKQMGPDYICTPDQIPKGIAAYAYGQDLGVNDPHVLLEGAIANDGILYITAEYYRAGLDIIQHIPNLRAMYRNGWPIFSDHSATQHSIMLREGFSMHKAIKDVLDGIQKVQARFTLKGIKISTACQHLISELYSFCWKDSPNAVHEAPEHKYSHAPDVLRYLICGIDSESIFDA